MEIKDTYKLKRFGTYLVEIDTDDIEAIEEVSNEFKKALRWRFIKIILIPKGLFKIKNAN